MKAAFVGITLSLAAMLGGCGGTSAIGSGEESSSYSSLQAAGAGCSGDAAVSVPSCDNPYGPSAQGIWCVNDPVRPGGKGCAGFAIAEPQESGCTLTSGSCMMDCTADSECPDPGSGTSKPECGQVRPAEAPMLCLLPCDNGETCPDTMTCKHVEQGRTICLFEMPCLAPLPEGLGAGRPCMSGEY